MPPKRTSRTRGNQSSDPGDIPVQSIENFDPIVRYWRPKSGVTTVSLSPKTTQTSQMPSESSQSPFIPLDMLPGVPTNLPPSTAQALIPNMPPHMMPGLPSELLMNAEPAGRNPAEQITVKIVLAYGEQGIQVPGTWDIQMPFDEVTNMNNLIAILKTYKETMVSAGNKYNFDFPSDIYQVILRIPSIGGQNYEKIMEGAFQDDGWDQNIWGAYKDYVPSDRRRAEHGMNPMTILVLMNKYKVDFALRPGSREHGSIQGL